MYLPYVKHNRVKYVRTSKGEPIVNTPAERINCEHIRCLAYALKVPEEVDERVQKGEKLGDKI